MMSRLKIFFLLFTVGPVWHLTCYLLRLAIQSTLSGSQSHAKLLYVIYFHPLSVYRKDHESLFQVIIETIKLFFFVNIINNISLRTHLGIINLQNVKLLLKMSLHIALGSTALEFSYRITTSNISYSLLRENNLSANLNL